LPDDLRLSEHLEMEDAASALGKKSVGDDFESFMGGN